MNKTSIFASAFLGGMALLSLTPVYAESVTPCEDMARRLNEVVAATKLSPAQQASIDALKEKGIAACKRDHDAEADGFFQQAIDIAQKK